MNALSARLVAGSMAFVMVLAACGSGSDADLPDTVPNGSDAVDVAADGSDDAVFSETGSDPSLPANIWPEEIVEPSAESEGDAKSVVTRAPGATGDGVQPQGVELVTARVTAADGEVCEVCLWLADDDTTRQRGLMDVTDLGDAVGMAFVWEQPRTGNFFMFQTPTPLSIAWFDAAGSHVGEADMEPCLVENSASCERYTADAPYVLAVEMFGGQLDAIGIGPGSTVELLDLDCA